MPPLKDNIDFEEAIDNNDKMEEDISLVGYHEIEYISENASNKESTNTSNSIRDTPNTKNKNTLEDAS